MKIKLTKDLVEKTEPEAKDLFLWDTELPGFGVKISPLGRRVYVAQYRTPDGRSKRMTFGQHGTVTIDQARKAAKIKLGKAAVGDDPAAEKLDARQSPTIKELGERYMKEHAATKKKASSAAGDRWLLDKVISPTLGTARTIGLTRAEVAALHHKLEKKPYIANRALALLSKMMDLAEKWGLRPDGSNPCRHIERYKEEKRRRYLDFEELARLGAVLAKAERDERKRGSKELVAIPGPAIQAIRLIIFTGCRLNEILAAKWEYLKQDGTVLELDDSKTGFKAVPLNVPAREVIEKLPVIEGNPYLISGQKAGSHLVGLGHIWNRIRKAAEIPDVRIHDLRHSFASIGAALQLGLPVIGGILGHVDPKTTARYTHMMADPLMAASELIGNKIDTAMKAKPKIRRVK